MPDRQRKETLAADERAGTDLPDERLGNYRPRVLLVDDQPENLVALRAVAETLDVDAVCAESGMAALRELLHSDFAIIVLDVQMPELDGFETAQLIKSRERSRNVPILFLTAIHREERYALRAYGLGAADYVTKPVDAEVLRAKLKAFVDLDRARAQISSQAERLREVERVAFRRRADARFRALAETLPIVLFTADRNGNVTYGNERFRGAHRDDDGDVSAIASPEDQDALRAGFAIALSSKMPFVTDVRLRIPVQATKLAFETLTSKSAGISSKLPGSHLTKRPSTRGCSSGARSMSTIGEKPSKLSQHSALGSKAKHAVRTNFLRSFPTNFGHHSMR